MTDTSLGHDPVLRDSRIATRIFLVCAVLLLFGASIGLNTWPGQSFWLVAQGKTDARGFLFTFQTFSVVFVALFWGARPGRAQMAAVLVGWLVLSLLALWLVPGTWEMIWPDPKPGAWYLFFVATLAVPSVIASVWRVAGTGGEGGPAKAKLRLVLALTLLFILVPQPLLSLGATFHPLTFDAHALHWDRLAGLNITPQLTAWVDAVPFLPQWVTFAYGITPLVFLAVPLLQLQGRPAHVPSALLLWVVMTGCAVIAYQVLPITGPKYVFGPDRFLDVLGAAADVPLKLYQVEPYPRNGMPSMHFGWLLAACIMWWQMRTRAWSRLVMLVMTSLTAIATLYLGEHYFVDLIVAVPFVLACLALSSLDVAWKGGRRRVVYVGFATWLAWVSALRFGIGAIVELPWLCHLMTLGTLAIVALQIAWMRRFSSESPGTDVDRPERDRGEPMTADHRRLQWQVGLMFFVSGAAALIYQVLFSKQLALVFGSTATATITVLATFLGGMALGSLIGGAVAHRTRRHLALYAYIEVGIGAYCALTPRLFDWTQHAYVALASGVAPDSPALLVLRVVLGASVLLVPTVLMGITLPLLAQALGPQSGRMGSRAAWLYFANTGGAAFGALVSAYAIIPALGAQRTTLVAALLNFLVALGALELAKRLAPNAGSPALAEPPEFRATEWPKRVRVTALAVLACCGFLSLGLEVVYVHLLSVVAGNSVYAFGLMLATFLIGLSVGGEAARRLLLRPGVDTHLAMVYSLLGLCVAIALGSFAWNAIPEYFASFEGYPLARSFAAREAIRGVVCSLVMIPPTLFIGATYVLAMDIVTSSWTRPRAQMLGFGSALNTGGNIAGVLLFGFVLLPFLGGLKSSHLVAAGALALAAISLVVASRASARAAVIGGAVASLGAFGVLAASATQRLDYGALSSGSNVYFAAQSWGQIIDHAESIDGGLTTVARRDSPPPAVHTLLTNGKFQGNDAMDGEMQAQIGFAMAPLLHQERRGSALVIGYGSGATSRVFHDAGFAQLDIAELSADIVRLADRHFASVNAGVTQAPGVRLHVTDGRNMLLLGEGRQYDVVSIEISSIWFAGAASLYNQEFYQLVRSRLAPDGVLQQWVQMHRLAPTDLLTVIATIRAEFQYVSLYMIGSQGILVATNAEQRAAPRPEAIAQLKAAAGLEEVRRIVGRDLAALTEERLLDAAGIDRFLAAFGKDLSIWFSTDDNLRLEYSTPKANVNDPERSIKANIGLFGLFR